MILLDVVVIVPGLARAVPHLHKADAAFEQTAGNEQLPGLCAGTVHLADVFGLLLNVERIGGINLHPIGELE